MYPVNTKMKTPDGTPNPIPILADGLRVRELVELEVGGIVVEVVLCELGTCRRLAANVNSGVPALVPVGLTVVVGVPASVPVVVGCWSSLMSHYR